MTKYISNPDQSRVRDIFEYLPTGELLRKSLNKITGSPNKLGYKYTKIDGNTVPVHRLIYIYHHGTIPSGYHVDHKNNNPRDNRIENLQLLPANRNLGKHRNGRYLKIIDRLDQLYRDMPLEYRGYVLTAIQDIEEIIYECKKVVNSGSNRPVV
jgi:hypothetical protein